MRIGSSVAYLDSSALLKIAVDEAENDALRSALPAWSRRASSRLSAVEVLRAARRRSPAAVEPARRVLAGLSLISVDRRVLAHAVDLEPAVLRTLDAIHLASALRLGRALAAFVSYDERQLEAARELGLTAASPR